MHTLADIRAEFKISFDSGDPWGSTMGAWFRVADSLTFHHGEDVPDEWKFRPSPMGRGDDPDEDSDAAFFDECDPDALLEFGNLLSRYAGYLKRKGRDY